MQQLATIKPFVFERLQVGLGGSENVKSGDSLRLQRAASVESISQHAAEERATCFFLTKQSQENNLDQDLCKLFDTDYHNFNRTYSSLD